MMEAKLSLIKVPVSALGAAAALLGYAAGGGDCAAGAALLCLSVFLLAAGACSLNNYQDRYFDERLERTRKRPLPSRRIAPGRALIQSMLLLSAGMGGLFLCSASPFAPLAGLLAVMLYNGLYTPLKKKTLLALIPGVLCGTFPPLIGWLAAGGEINSPGLAYLMVLFGAWQLPHLWLLVLANCGDERLGHAPSFLDAMSETQMQRLIVTWTAAFGFLTLFLKVFRFIDSGVLSILLAANAFALPLIFALAPRTPWGAARSRYLSRYLNVSVFGVTLLAAADILSR